MDAALAEKFLFDLTSSRLLTEEQLAGLRDEVTRSEHALGSQEIASWLVERGLLTRWQVQMLLANRTAFFLGKYKLLKELGRGGMGAVFQAEQVPLGRKVALKVMASHLIKDQAAVARFHREIQAAAALHHPNIVTAFDADQVQRTHILVMEFVEGESLDDLLRRKTSLPIQVACEYIRQAALGLQHAHEQGMAHRDIKPANLLVTRSPDGEATVKILDFGLARFTSAAGTDGGGLTQTGQIMGTPDYIAPEQAKDTRSADIRSDIFSLGCSLYRALTGRLPFEGQSIMEKLMARSLNDATPLRRLLPTAPPELEAVLARMLARDPAERFQTPQDVVRALEPFTIQHAAAAPPPRPGPSINKEAEGEFAPLVDRGLNQFLQDLAHEAALDEQSETPTGASNRLASAKSTQADAALPTVTRAGQKLLSSLEEQRKKDRRQYRLLMALVVGVALIGVAVWGWQRGNRSLLIVEWPENERSGGTIVVDGRPAAVPQVGKLELAGPSGPRTLLLTRKGYIDVAEEWTLQRGQSQVYRPKWHPLPETERRVQWERLRRDVEQDLVRLRQEVAAATDPRVRSQRARLNEFQRRWPKTAEARESLALGMQFPAAADAFQRSRIYPYELRAAGGGDPAEAPPELVAVLGNSRLRHWERVSGVAIGKDGKVVASSSVDDSIRLWDSSTGDQLRVLHGLTKRFYSLSWSGDGRYMAAEVYAETATVWDVSDGSHIVSFPGKRPVFSKDDQLLATGGPEIQIWSVGTWKNVRTLSLPKTSGGQTASVGHPEFSPDGKILAASVSWDNGPAIVQLWNLQTGEALASIHPAQGDRLSLAFSPDGNLLATVAGTLKLWNVPDGNFVRSFEDAEHAGCVVASLSPDTRSLGIGHGDGTVTLRSITDGQVLQTLLRHRQSVACIAFDASGNLLTSGSHDGTVGIWRVSASEPPRSIHRADPVLLAAVSSPAGHFGVLEWDADVCSFRDATDGKEIWRLDLALKNPPHVTLTEDHSLCAMGQGFDGIPIGVFDVETGRELYQLPQSQLVRPPFAFNPEGTLFVGVADNRHLHVWDVAKAELRHRIDVGMPDIIALGFAPDGSTVAIQTRSAPQVVLCNAATGKILRTVEFNKELFWCLQFTVGGKSLVSGDDWGSVEVWDVASSREKRLLHPRAWSTCNVTSLGSTRDRRRVAAAIRNGTVGVWKFNEKNTEEVVLRRVGPGMGYIPEVAFSPEGRHLLARNGNGTIYVLRLEEWLAEPKDR